METSQKQKINLNLILRTPRPGSTTPPLPYPIFPTHSITTFNDSTILQLKELLSVELKGKPKVEGITLVTGSRVLNDNDVLYDLFKDAAPSAIQQDKDQLEVSVQHFLLL